MPSTAIVWFRRDLRLADNPALVTAASQHEQLIPVYLHAPEEEAPWPTGAASNWWLHHSLKALDACLRERGTRLVILRGNSLACLRALIAASAADAVFWNRCYEPTAIARDTGIKQQLRALGLRCESHNAGLLFEPWEIKTSVDQPFKVFSAFWRRCQAKRSDIPSPLPAPAVLPPLPQKFTATGASATGTDLAPSAAAVSVAEVSIDAMELLPRIHWDAGFAEIWQPGSAEAEARLQRFLDKAAVNYAEARDQPGVEGTSKLSPHLHFGEIGPRQLLFAALAASEDTEAFVRELGWREFSMHLLFHFPHTAGTPLHPLFAHFPWRDPVPPELLRAWQQGQTGIPLVDAGMRQLWRVGWMHNRVRMIVASFLTKNLRIPWQIGARWFWDTLVDADLASNTQGWQWTAGCGADAAPYFRVFNPVRQGERFDPEGHFVRHWCPELAQLPKRYIHQPWTAPVAVLQQANVELGASYPRPLVDLADSRREALAFWQQLRDTDSN